MRVRVRVRVSVRLELRYSRARAGLGFGGGGCACSRWSDLAASLFARLASTASSAALVTSAVVDRKADSIACSHMTRGSTGSLADTAGADGGASGDRALLRRRARFACVSWAVLEPCGLRLRLRLRLADGFGSCCFARAPLVSASRSCTPLVLRAALAISRARVAPADAAVDRIPA